MNSIISASGKARFLFPGAALLMILAAAPGLAATPQLSAGEDFTIVLKADGSLWGWGENGYGQLADNTSTDRRVPEEINSIAGVETIVCGNSHTLAVRTDGTLWAWGRNSSGRLGDGTTSTRRLPVQIGTDTNWTAVAGG